MLQTLLVTLNLSKKKARKSHNVVDVIQTQRIDASLAKTGYAWILLLSRHGWKPKPKLLNRHPSKQQ